MDYKNAGVDIEAGYKSVELMKEHVKGTIHRDLVTVMWANEPFDPENPDTYYEEV